METHYEDGQRSSNWQKRVKRAYMRGEEDTITGL